MAENRKLGRPTDQRMAILKNLTTIRNVAAHSDRLYNYIMQNSRVFGKFFL